MNGRSVRTAVSRGVGIAVAVAAVAGLLYVASVDESDADDGPTYWESLAVVSLVGLGGWAALAARSHVRRQDASIIERVPRQPGDADVAGARISAERGAAGGKRWVQDRLSGAPAELSGLHAAIRAAGASSDAYEERLRPRLRELAAARAAAAGRRVDVDAITDLGIDSASAGRVACAFMGLAFFRRSVRVRSIARVIRTIEELNDGDQQGTRAV